MNVGLARKLLSREVAAGILYYIEKQILPEEARTTAIFIALFADWFKIISNRSVAHALHYSNTIANEESIFRVMLFANLFSQCEILDRKRFNCWTAVQRGVLVKS